MKSMHMKSLLTIALLFCISGVLAQITVSGFIEDAQSKERLPGVHIYETNSRRGTTSNSFGFYSLTLAASDTIQLRFSFIGYRQKIVIISQPISATLNIQLDAGIELDEVTIKAERISTRPVEMGLLRIPVIHIKQIPAIMGEADVLRVFQLMPGVQGGKEGSSGIHVRGGSPDQNLILLDDIPLYYVNHIGGYVSVFNPDALKSVELYKGGFPARYGGRLSSVMDIRMKEGSMTDYSGNITAGIISSKFTFEGPVRKDKTSFMISARRSLFDLITHAYFLLTDQDFTAGYNLYDYNGKINHIINDKNRLYFSFYSGRDRVLVKSNLSETNKDHPYKYKSKNDLNWGNHNISLRWNHVHSSKLFSNTTVGFTRFFYNSFSDAQRFDKQTGKKTGHLYNRFSSEIDDIIAKTDFDYNLDEHQLKFGGGLTRHKFTPTMNKISRLASHESFADTAYGSPAIKPVSFVIYGEDRFTVSEKFYINAGLHFAGFIESRHTYLSLQPRFMGSYSINQTTSVKASYTEMMQPVHLLSNNEAGLPADLWVPATKNVPPQRSAMVALGLYGESNFKVPITWSVEAFYKTFRHLIEFSENASFFTGAANWAEKIEKNGKGTAYGIEFLIQKTQGNTTGWIAYTLSYNIRQFENLNYGEPYPYRYDRRHDFSITFNHKFSPKISLSASWVFTSGHAITLPTTAYELYVLEYENIFTEYWGNVLYHYDNEVHIYGHRNNYRMPSHHRLDVSLDINNQLQKGYSTWTIGVYNAYNRLNPYYLYFKNDKEGNRKLYSFSLFPFMPSVSYSYRF
jgi:hypothetical protein